MEKGLSPELAEVYIAWPVPPTPFLSEVLIQTDKEEADAATSNDEPETKENWLTPLNYREY